MTRVTSQLSISLDGFAAGPDQTRDDPLGTGGERLHGWYMGGSGPRHPADEAAARSILEGNGAYIMGRNMFGPIRGEWEGDWRGWWGDDPPYHAPVFVLTHHPREPQPMDGGTTYHFVTDGIESALAQARAAAGDGDVAIQGGATTINQYLGAGLIDELRLHIVPLTLGAGTRLFEGVPPLKLEQVKSRAARLVTHVTYRVLS
jgi:dihydrofolate reductase